MPRRSATTPRGRVRLAAAFHPGGSEMRPSSRAPKNLPGSMFSLPISSFLIRIRIRRPHGPRRSPTFNRNVGLRCIPSHPKRFRSVRSGLGLDRGGLGR